MEFTLSPESLREITEDVRKQLPVPNGGTKLEKVNSSVKVHLTDDGSIRGTGRSSFEYSNGMIVNATWHLLVVDLEIMVIIDPEEVVKK